MLIPIELANKFVRYACAFSLIRCVDANAFENAEIQKSRRKRQRKERTGIMS